MKTITSFIAFAALVVLVIALIPEVCTAEEGFLGLKWRASEEEARKVFNDLELKFKPCDKPDVLQPWYGYIRKNESFKLGDLPPDEVTYLFTKKGFDAVIARIGFYDSARSAVPGRYEKLKEEYATSYEMIKKNLISKYGEPESDEDFMCKWKLAGTNIMLSLTSNDVNKNYLNLVLSYSYKPKDR